MRSFTESMFTGIYEHHLWPEEETRSGEGSTLSYTEKFRTELPKLFEQFNITSVLDAPCG
jgi:hypothetical protein